MPSYKYQTAAGRVLWLCTFYYRDYTGRNVKKKKSGFSTKREADAFERDFLAKKSGSPSMTFRQLFENYMDDVRNRLKPSSIRNRENAIKKHVLPTFGDMPLDAITPGTVRSWENDLLTRGLAPSMMHLIRAYLSILLNYAVRFYGLPANPVRLAGPMKAATATAKKRLHFWTVEQFDRFILSGLEPEYIVLFSLLFWTGMRVGEARALTVGDVDLDAGTVRVNKTLSYVPPSEFHLQAPKTTASNRVITLPKHATAMLAEWMQQLGAVEPGQMLFLLCYPRTINGMMHTHAEKAGLPEIRVHDLRHSHASMLIHLGFPPMVIRDRLGHKDIQTTLNTYSHLYRKRLTTHRIPPDQIS